MSAQWEVVIDLDDRNESVRRLDVQTGWIYQAQTGVTYSTAAGTIGRERDFGSPTWSPPVFVPHESK